jgi:transposase-like protein
MHFARFWCKGLKQSIFAANAHLRNPNALTIFFFKGRHFDQEIIILGVRWYLRFKLSFRDLVEMMAERGVSLAHTTIMRWIQRYVPEFEKRWNRFAFRAGGSWRVDETYVKIKGRWTYLYRAVDKQGKTVDFLLRAKRDVAAAKAFFRRAFKSQGRLPRAITLEVYQASRRAAREILGEHHRCKRTKIRSSKSRIIDRSNLDWSNAGIEALSERLNHYSRHRADAQDQKRSVQTRKASHQKQNGA